MPKVILFVCGKTDLTADLVLLELQRRKDFEVVRLNVEDFPTRIGLSARTQINKNFWSLNFLIPKSKKQFDFQKVRSVYYRPHQDPRPSRKIKDPLYKELIKEQSTLVIEWLEDILNCFWLNSPRAISRARSKALQLKIASRLGFLTPDSLITNDPKEALNFYNKHEGNVAAKLLQATPTTRKLPGFIFTRRLTRQDLQLIHQVRYSPVLFQEYIPKKYEIRATVVGGKVFGAKINSQLLEETKDDWRRYEFGKPPPHSILELPEDIETKLVKMNEELGLKFGAYDLVFTPEKEYVFLELNANGQWGWIQELTKMPISQAIANLLMKGGK